MDENVNDTADVDGEGNSRRDIIKKAAIGGAVVWAAPTLLAGRAAAASPPDPPLCTFVTVTANWQLSDASIPAGDNYLWIENGPIPSPNGAWNGTNVDLVRAPNHGTPPWTIATDWLDLVGFTASGNGVLSTVVSIPAPCEGLFELSFRSSQRVGETGAGVDVSVVASSGPSVSDSFVPTTDPLGELRTYSLGLSGPTTVTITLTGTSAGLNAGAVIGNVSFAKV